MAETRKASTPGDAKREALTRLRFFNEKAEELQMYSFIGKVAHEEAGIKFTWNNETATMKWTRTGADNEARAAVCLILRFFLQEKDKIAIHQVVDLYEGLPVPEEDKFWVKENLKELDDFLDSDAGINVNGKSTTHRSIIETFLYGDLAHANPDKRTTLSEWKAWEPIYSLLENRFEIAVCGVIKYVIWLAAMNRDALKALDGS